MKENPLTPEALAASEAFGEAAKAIIKEIAFAAVLQVPDVLEKVDQAVAQGSELELVLRVRPLPHRIALDVVDGDGTRRSVGIFQFDHVPAIALN